MRKLVSRPLFVIVLATLILRIPNLFEPYWYGDEGIYLIMGEGIRQGLVLYKDIFDHKPPIIYLLAALSGSLFWFKFTLLVWHATTIFVFWKLAKVFISQSAIKEKDYTKATTLSTSFFALFTTLPTFEGNIVNAELLMAGPILFGLYLLLKKIQGALVSFLIGLIFSVSVLLKVPSVLDVGSIILFLLISGFAQKKNFSLYIKTVSFFTLGILFSLSTTLLYFYSKGAFREYLQAGLLQNIDYVKSSQTSFFTNLKIFEGLPLRFEILVLAVFAIFLARRYFDKTTLLSTLWLLFTLFSALLSNRPYPHYLIQTLAPLSLVIISLVFGKDKYRFLTIPFLFLFLSSLVFYNFSYYKTLPYYSNFSKYVLGLITENAYFKNFDQRTPRTYKLAQYLVERTRSSERIFIWGTEPEVYALSRRLPPGRFTTSFHIVDFSGQTETLEALEQNPPGFILKVKDEKRILPGFDKFLTTQYLYTDTIQGVEIWKKKIPNMAKIISL